jgi:hypothetical protein
VPSSRASVIQQERSQDVPQIDTFPVSHNYHKSSKNVSKRHHANEHEEKGIKVHGQGGFQQRKSMPPQLQSAESPSELEETQSIQQPRVRAPCTSQAQKVIQSELQHCQSMDGGRREILKAALSLANQSTQQAIHSDLNPDDINDIDFANEEMFPSVETLHYMINCQYLQAISFPSLRSQQGQERVSVPLSSLIWVLWWQKPPWKGMALLSLTVAFKDRRDAITRSLLISVPGYI